MKNKIIPIDPDHPDPALILKAANIIKNGGIIAFPSDTCYGLATNPFDAQAVDRLFKIKGRDACKGIILLVSSMEMLEALTKNLSPLSKSMMKAFWPGPLTLILEKKPHLSDRLSGTHQTIGIRYPKAQIPIQLIKKTGFPISATSANKSGETSAQSAEEIKESLGENLDLILDAGHCKGLPSTIIDTTVIPPKLLRKGALSEKRMGKLF